MKHHYNICDFGARPDGTAICTVSIQSALNEAVKTSGTVIVPPGIYLTGALFVGSRVELFLDKGAVLLGSAQEYDYPLRSSRVAGIEMDWPAGVLNILDAAHVRVYGQGTIDGQGENWWKKYWGTDGRSGMRAQYEQQGLRWAVDYDCARARNVVIFNSNDVTIEEITLRRSGFWNLHLCYSRNVAVQGITICDNPGPSSDGIDIDSCRDVLVENCRISCNDDNICVKSGRGADGLRVNRPCENVIVRNNTLLEGEGITLGSETSGGIRHLRIENNVFFGTKNGLRLKSARMRGGIIEDVEVSGMCLRDVGRVFCFDFDWYPAYSQCRIPDSNTKPIPAHWHTLLAPVPEGQGLPVARNIRIRNVQAEHCGEAVYIHGLKEAPFEHFTFEDMSIYTKKFGEIAYMRDIIVQNSEFFCGGNEKGAVECELAFT